jgi:hypothetical protein
MVEERNVFPFTMGGWVVWWNPFPMAVFYYMLAPQTVHAELAPGEGKYVFTNYGDDEISAKVTRLAPGHRMVKHGMLFTLTSNYDEQYMPLLLRMMEMQHGLPVGMITLFKPVGAV